MLAGQLMTGLAVSLTVTVKLLLEVLPTASVAVALTVVVPFGNTEFDAGVVTTVAPGQLSATVTIKLTTAEHAPGSVDLTIFAGTLIVGNSASFTVTVWLAEAVLPLASVAVQVIVVTPFGYGRLIARPSLRVEVTVSPGQLSDEEATPTLSVLEH